MFDAFTVGGEFPRPEDMERLRRYEQARALFDGKHFESTSARRLEEKLRNVMATNSYTGEYTAEGLVYLIYNLSRLICAKFADLQVLQPPILLMDSEDDQGEFEDRLRSDIPDQWAVWHWALQLKRALGEVVVTYGQLDGALTLRACDPARWFPILDDGDPLRIELHQLVTVEDHEVSGKLEEVLRVETCGPNVVERTAFVLKPRKEQPVPVKYSVKGASSPPEQIKIPRYSILRELTPEEFGQLWPGLPLRDEADLGGLCPAVQIRNGRLDPSEVWGRPEFYDSATLIDDINWRLGTWSDVNDLVAHPPRILPSGYLDQDEDGRVLTPSRYTAVYAQQNRSGEAGEVPKYMVMQFAHDTLKEQFEASVLAFLVRHEMSPALLGIQFGLQKESGDAKSLGMGTTEAATRRDLLETQPCVDEVYTGLARLGGNSGADVSTYWRIGLPKSQAELMQELEQKDRLGLLTRKDKLEALYPFMTDEQIEAKLQELADERAAEAKEAMQADPGFAFEE